MNEKAIDHRSVEVDGKPYRLEVEDHSVSWGKGVKVTVYDSNNVYINSINYNCHPEFDDYDYFQSKSVSELVGVAVDKIVEDINSNKFKSAAESGLNLSVPINDAASLAVKSKPIETT